MGLKTRAFYQHDPAIASRLAPRYRPCRSGDLQSFAPCIHMADQSYSYRADRYLRRLEAMMLVADKSVSLALTGTGDVLEPEHGVMAIGSGGNYALAAARALMDTDKDVEEIARKAMQIASDICVYTNNNFV